MRYSRVVLAAVLIVVGSSSNTAFAVTSSSSNYQVTETQFNASSSQQSCSGEYCARVSIGDTAVGGSEGTLNKAEFGPVTPEEPTLEVIVEAGESNLGELTTEQTATKTMVVRIRNYLSNGYVLQIIGDPPKYNGRPLATPTTPTASVAGTEQFGLNAVANTVPNVGAGPVQVPSDQVSFGKIHDDYKIANRFMYSSGDVVGQSDTESGRTDYTISMIVNVSSATPAGNYATDFAAVVIPVY